MQREEKIMNTTNSVLLVKFGEKEHLERLKNGEIFFSKISNYRNDGTHFRGDRLEGKYLIDPTSVKIFDKNGTNLLEGLPPPTEVVKGYADDDDTLMFCAAGLSTNNLIEVEKNRYKLTKAFKKSMQEFGAYALIFWSSDLCSRVSKCRKQGMDIAYETRFISYRDKSNFDEPIISNQKSNIDLYFVKDKKYQAQNEWRMIIDGEKEPLKLNHEKGYILNIEPIEDCLLLPTKELFDEGIILSFE